MASRLIIWILLTMLSLQGGFAASTFHCQVASQTVSDVHVRIRHVAQKEHGPQYDTSLQSAQASIQAHHHDALTPQSTYSIDHHTQSNGAHHRHKMPCCDSAGGTAPSLAFFLPESISAPVDVEQPHKPPDVFLDGPTRPPKLFHI